MHDLRFLFLLYAYPPDYGTAAKRNFRIAEYLKNRVGLTRIFTAARQAHDDHQAHIETISPLDYRSVLRRSTRDAAVPEHRKHSAFAQFFIRLINTFPINIIAGEGGLMYFLKVLRRGSRTIRQNNITHIYSSYRPFADHYAAYWLKKKHPQVHWIADFRDLIIDPHYRHIFFEKKHHRLFKKLFSRADLLTTVSDGLAGQLKAYNEHVLALRNGVADNLKKPEPVPSAHFTITYSGSMFLDKRNAEPLFQAVRELFQELQFQQEDIRIVYAGKDGHQWKRLAKEFYFESVFEDKGILTPEETRYLQRASCVNVLLTISSDQLQGVLTGKMIEYFEAGIPVLGIVVNQNDEELQTLLQSLSIGDSFSDQYKDIEGIKAFLLKEYNHWKTMKANRIAVDFDKLVSDYSMKAVMQPFFERIKSFA